MSAFDAFLRLLRGWFELKEPDEDGGGDPDPEPEPSVDIPEPVSPLSYSGNGDATRLDVRVYQSAALAERRGKTPMQNAVRFLSQALREAGYNYEIHYVYEPVSGLPEEAATMPTLNWWSGHAPNQTAEIEVYLLLLDIEGNGLAFHGESNTRSGRYSLAPGRKVERLLELVIEEPDHGQDKPNEWTNTRAQVHEVGHNLGGRHSDNMIEPPELVYREPSDFLDAPGP